MIGKFEELVLLALVRAGPNSNAAKVYSVMDRRIEKVPQFAALYTALDRLSRKGLITERDSDAAAGRPRRLFTISGEGRRALDEAINASRALMTIEGAATYNV